ncbi:MAG: helix-turn-helix domain-containing protein [Alphaproteobacteria bacterium]|nr:MAG: helix-turn-helix domain-containing protein [Alphaproteobacteria bacterium]
MDTAPLPDPTLPVARARRIGLVVLDDFALMSYAALTEPFRAANLLAGRPLYRLIHYGPAAGAPIASSGAARLAAEAPFGAALSGPARCDLLLVVAGGDPDRFLAAPVQGPLRALARRGLPLGGVSGGPLVLAAAGLCDGRRVTVHWEHAERMAALAPRALIERSLYVIDRDRVSCGGGTAPLDLAHAMIAAAHGTAFARQVSDWFLHTEVRPPGAAQRAGLIERWGTRDRAVLDALALMESHLAGPLPLAELAARVGLGPRQLSRRFRAALGRPPAAVHRAIRLDAAARLLRQPGASVTEVALATGFASAAHFAAAFRARHGRSPAEWAGRRRAAAKGH